jgi:hypothetical protein
MKSLGERLLELRERYVVATGLMISSLGLKPDESEAIYHLTEWPSGLNSVMVRTVAIERAAVRELRKEGTL